MGRIVRGLSRVGIYVPGGTAAYPSSVLMNAVPAKVAGVEEIVMVTPPTENLSDAVLAAAKIAGVDRCIAVGGQTDPEGLRIAPTVLVDVPEGSPVLEEEIFGPILPVLLYRSLPELVEAQRQKPRPLALYLFTRSRSVERAVLEALPFGGGCVNDTILHLASSRLPFGGVGNSGMGACHGKAGFDAFTHEKSVLKKGRLDIPVRYPPYGKKHLGILKKLM